MAGTNGQKSRRRGIWSSSEITLDQKRARNRESQRSFRERRMLRLQELEAQVQSLSAGKDEREAILISENNSMKEKCLRAKQQVEHLDMMLRNLKETLNTGLDCSKSSTCARAGSQGTPANIQSRYQHSTETNEAENNNSVSSHCLNALFHPGSPASESPPQQAGQAPSMDDDLTIPEDPAFQALTGFCDDEFGWPSIVDLLGPSPDSGLYLNPLLPDDGHIDIVQISSVRHIDSSDASRTFTPSLRATGLPKGARDGHLAPSEFSMKATESHSFFDSASEALEAMESCLLAFIQSQGGQVSDDFLNKACLVLMIFFFRYAWPGPTELFLGTFTYAMAEHMLLWRIEQANRSSVSLPIYLTPSNFQLTTRHSPMLGWVGIAPLRERMIQNFKSNSKSDQVWLDLMAYTVVEVEEISSIIAGVGYGRGFLGVWNIFEVFDDRISPPNQQQQQQSPRVDGAFPELSKLDEVGLLRVYRMQLPDIQQLSTDTAPRLGRWAPVTLQQLFSSRALAKRLYYHLELYNSHKTWRMDPAFFEKYQSLTWDGYQQYTARGICLRAPPRLLSRPKGPREKILHDFQDALRAVNGPMTL
ncbi:hypothetical protein BDV12DRAFT_179870 [Aspergillus spectabilis]